MPFLDENQIREIGFKEVGKHVLISDKCAIYNASNIRIGDHSRIDDFSILSAGPSGLTIGQHVHIACFCSIQGAESIVLEDYSALSSRVAVYSSTDDYSGGFLTNPTVPARFRNVISKPVFLEKHVLIGAGSVILPGVHIGLGTAVGAMSLVTKRCKPFSVYFGIPAKKLIDRSKKLIDLEHEHQKEVCLNGSPSPR